jgi:hypothetical protein
MQNRKGQKARYQEKASHPKDEISTYEITTPIKIEVGLAYLSFSRPHYTSHLSIQLATVDSSR